MDFRQIIAAFLTMSMFVMLGNMIKKEHIDPLFSVDVPASLDIQNNVFNVKVARLPSSWKEDVNGNRPCWKKYSALKDQREHTTGFVFFSLANGPEYHALQIADAILIAKHLRAALVLPDIRGTIVGEKRTFGEVYDIKHFMTNLQEVVQVVENNQFIHEQRGENTTTIVKVSKKVTKEFVCSNIEPVFRSTKQVSLESHYPSSTLTKAYQTSDDDSMNPYACLAIFGSLKLKSELQDLVDMMVKTLQFLSMKTSEGKFIVVDLRFEDFERKMSCQKINGTTSKKSCFGVKHLCQWLEKIGFERNTIIYLTQTGWHKSLQSLRESYPNTFTKDYLMPLDMKARYLDSKKFPYEKYVDFYLSTQSNVFVPLSLNLFYTAVSGMRIALGNTQIMVHPLRRSSTYVVPTKNFLSPFVLDKSHIAYSCLCN